MEDELAKVAAEMEELKEEHGGEEGIMRDVSSKADAQEAWTEAIVPIWNEEDATPAASTPRSPNRRTNWPKSYRKSAATNISASDATRTARSD